MDSRELGWGEGGQGTRDPQSVQLCNLDPVSLALGQVILHQEGHMDDGLTLQRCQREESQAARIIRNTTALFSQFVRYVSSFRFSACQFLLHGHPSPPAHPSPFFKNLFRAMPMAYGGSQAMGRIRDEASGLHHSHSNAGSEPCLQPTP